MCGSRFGCPPRPSPSTRPSRPSPRPWWSADGPSPTRRSPRWGLRVTLCTSGPTCWWLSLGCTGRTARCTRSSPFIRRSTACIMCTIRSIPSPPSPASPSTPSTASSRPRPTWSPCFLSPCICSRTRSSFSRRRCGPPTSTTASTAIPSLSWGRRTTRCTTPSTTLTTATTSPTWTRSLGRSRSQAPPRQRRPNKVPYAGT
mmetsp:Transcript_66318/g.209647  ORF Transcript_66318/g.209647 Transcript_66318/m.209647 type:complete len:201 (+) Transcript_66318:565-1167(+)